jgi:hypothetical protein
MITSMAGHRLVLADVDGDGTADVVFAVQVNGIWMLVSGLSRGDGAWDWEPLQATPWPNAPNEDSRLFAGDFDGDGRKDVLLDRAFGSPVPDEIYVGLSAKGALTGRFILVKPSTPWARHVAIADVNGDGKDDLVLKDTLSSALASGSGLFDPPPSAPGKACAILLPADANGDGRADHICAQDQGGTIALQDYISPNAGVDVHRWMPADVNGDGIFELIYVHHRNPGYEIYTLFTESNSRVSDTILPSSSAPGWETPMSCGG